MRYLWTVRPPRWQDRVELCTGRFCPSPACIYSLTISFIVFLMTEFMSSCPFLPSHVSNIVNMLQNKECPVNSKIPHYPFIVNIYIYTHIYIYVQYTQFVSIWFSYHWALRVFFHLLLPLFISASFFLDIDFLLKTSKNCISIMLMKDFLQALPKRLQQFVHNNYIAKFYSNMRIEPLLISNLSTLSYVSF